MEKKKKKKKQRYFCFLDHLCSDTADSSHAGVQLLDWHWVWPGNAKTLGGSKQCSIREGKSEGRRGKGKGKRGSRSAEVPWAQLSVLPMLTALCHPIQATQRGWVTFCCHSSMPLSVAGQRSVPSHTLPPPTQWGNFPLAQLLCIASRVQKLASFQELVVAVRSCPAPILSRLCMLFGAGGPALCCWCLAP